MWASGSGGYDEGTMGDELTATGNREADVVGGEEKPFNSEEGRIAESTRRAGSGGAGIGG